MKSLKVNNWERSDWKEARAEGKARFIIRYGLIRFALPMALIMMVYFYIFEPLLFDGATWAQVFTLRWSELLEILLVSAIIWPLAGWAHAEWIWRRAEKRYPRAGSE